MQKNGASEGGEDDATPKSPSGGRVAINLKQRHSVDDLARIGRSALKTI